MKVINLKYFDTFLSKTIYPLITILDFRNKKINLINDVVPNTKIIYGEKEYPNLYKDISKILFKNSNNIFDEGLHHNIYRYSLEDQSDYIFNSIFNMWIPYLYPWEDFKSSLKLINFNKSKNVVCLGENSKYYFLALPYRVSNGKFIYLKYDDPVTVIDYIISKDVNEYNYENYNFRTINNNTPFIPYLLDKSIDNDPLFNKLLEIAENVEHIEYIDIQKINDDSLEVKFNESFDKYKEDVLSEIKLLNIDTSKILSIESNPNVFNDVNRILFNAQETIFTNGLRKNMNIYPLDDQLGYIFKQVETHIKPYFYYSEFNNPTLIKINDKNVVLLSEDEYFKYLAIPFPNNEAVFNYLSLEKLNFKEIIPELFQKLTEEYKLDDFCFRSVNSNDPFIFYALDKKRELPEKISSLLNNINSIDKINKTIYPNIKLDEINILKTDPEPEIKKINPVERKYYTSENKLDFSWKLSYEPKVLLDWGHRDGWISVINTILNNSNIESDRKILLIDFVEKNFSWDYVAKDSESKHIFINGQNYHIPWNDLRNINGKHVGKVAEDKYYYWDNDIEDWKSLNVEGDFYSYPTAFIDLPEESFVAFWHNPHNMPKWIDGERHPQVILSDPVRKACFEKYCKGIFVFSEYFKEYLHSQLPQLQINVLAHPTLIPDIRFDWDAFINNNDKKLVQIGYWLRDNSWIFKIKTNVYTKYWCYGSKKNLRYLKLDIAHQNDKLYNDVYCARFNDEKYDELLSANIAVLYLHDTSVNNAIIECIARATPIVVNYHPALVEYLGEDYPLFYKTLEECEEKIHNQDLLYKAHIHLKREDIKKKITYESFTEEFLNSEIISNLRKIN